MIRLIKNINLNSYKHINNQQKNVYFVLKRNFKTSSETFKTKLKSDFKTELNDTNTKLKNVEIQWEQWGNKNNEKVVLICPSLSVGSHARSTVKDPTTGWWENVIGAGKGIDTDKYRVICASNIGAPFGSTSPLSKNEENGEIYGPDFPQITPADVARAKIELLKELKIEKLHAVVGASFGGCTALSMAAEENSEIDIERLLVISCTGKTSAGSNALRGVQRDAVRFDPRYRNGRYLDFSTSKDNFVDAEGNDVRPLDGLRLARQFGMITYRSLDEFSQRFNNSPRLPVKLSESGTFEVERYLRANGDKFAKTFDANCYLLLSIASDLMDLGRNKDNFAQGVGNINAKTLIIGVENDMIIPFSEQQELYSVMKGLGKNVELLRYSSIFGHDAFFVDDHFFTPKIRSFLGNHILK